MSVITSFDVFDTVLIRNVTDPADLFLLVGWRLQRIGLTISPAAFRSCRVAAERRCRENCGDEEVTFNDIYCELAFTLGWDLKMRRSAESLELKVESQAITANPWALRLIEAARSSGSRIVFISDMYLPAEFIRGLLHRFGLTRDGDQYYVSSEHKATKSSGRLFRLVLKEERVQPWAMTHVGDQAHSDHSIPRRMGIATRPYKAACPNRYEAAMASFAVETDGLSGVFAGAARAARLCGSTTTDREAALWEAGTAVVGPILSAYVFWVLEQARKAGVERLYFLARDGYILRKIAQELAPAVASSVDLR